jgi:hypothetical protein
LQAWLVLAHILNIEILEVSIGTGAPSVAATKPRNKAPDANTSNTAAFLANKGEPSN